MITSTTWPFAPWNQLLEKGEVDAIYTQSKPFQHLQEATGKFESIEDLSRYPDWTLQVANIPAVIACTAAMADEHPELVVTFMKGMIKVGHSRLISLHAILEERSWQRAPRRRPRRNEHQT